MANTFKDFINHPLLAPLVRPIKAVVGDTLRAARESYIEPFMEGYTDAKKYGASHTGRLISGLMKMGEESFLSFLTVPFSAIGGALGLGFLASQAGSVGACIFAGTVGLVGGVVVSPVVSLVVATAFTAIVTPFTGGIAEFVRGCKSAIDYIKDPAAHIPPTPAQVQEQQAGRISKIEQEIDGLTGAERFVLITRLTETYKGTFNNVAVTAAEKEAAPAPTPTPPPTSANPGNTSPGGKK